MALDGGLLTNGNPVGEVGGIASVAFHQAVAAGFDEVLCQLEIARLPRLAVELHQRHLHDRMPVDVVAAVRTERLDQVVGEAHGDVEELPVPRAADLSHRRLDEVPGAVVLMAPGQVAVPLAVVLELHDRVEVAVGLLRRGDDRGDLALRLEQLGRRVPRVLPRRGLEPLVHVGVHEHRPPGLSRRGASGEAQVVQVARRLEPLLTGGDGHLAVHPLPVRPQPPGDVDAVERDRTQDAQRTIGRRDRTGYGVR